MAFPVVEATNTSTTDPGSTSHTVSLPASIVSGELLLIFFTCDSGGTNPTASGWTRILNWSASPHTFAVFYRQADGGEGGSVTVTTAGSVRSAHNSYRISGAEDPATQAPEISGGASGTSTTPNSDSLTPTGGAKDYLWVAAIAIDTTNATVAPTNYTNLLNVNSADDVAQATARRLLNAASEDPGTFTLSVSEQWKAVTVAVHPASAVALASQRLKIGVGR